MKPWFMRMPRNVPPASTVAPSPCSARSASASSSVVGASQPRQDSSSTTPVEPFTRIRSPGLDALAGVAGPDDRRDAELARDDGRVRHGAAGLRHEPGDLREQHDPRRVRHPADEDVALLDLVELVERGHVARRPLDHAGRRGQALDLAGRRRLARVELVREAPQRVVRERQRLLGGGADPRRRPALVRLLLLVAAVGHELAGVERALVGHQQPQLVVVEEDHVLRVVERARLDELAADRDRRRAARARSRPGRCRSGGRA